MNNNKNNQTKNTGNDGPFAIMALILVGCAIWYQKAAQIRFWFYQNLMTMVFYAFVAIALFVAYRVYRMKQKHEDELTLAPELEQRNPHGFRG